MKLLDPLGIRATEAEIIKAVKKADEFIETNYKENPIKHRRGFFFKVMCRMLGKNISQKIAKEKDMIFWEFVMKKVKLVPNAKEILTYIKNKGMSIVLISNGEVYGVNQILNKLNIRKYLDLIVISEEVGSEKCTSIPIQFALTKLGLKPNEVIMIGDRIDQDILGAKKLGIKNVKFNFGSHKDLNYSGQEIKPDFEIHNLLQVKKIL
jgi:HAD superfamily hydrolase (TIGR01549 family)